MLAGRNLREIESRKGQVFEMAVLVWLGLLGSGLGHLAALNGGYHVAFLVAALFAACASVLGAALLHFTAPTPSSQDESRNKQRAPEVPV